jgi:UDP-N-acetylmuramoyl-L-alanyl-D-glutamate--2,6-diaminopimelate ligase
MSGTDDTFSQKDGYLPEPQLLSAILQKASTINSLSAPIMPDKDALITSLSSDSRQASNGSLFFAIPGQNSDGHDFVAEAVKNGAVAAVVEKLLPLEIAQLVVASVREYIGPLADIFYGRPSQKLELVGITGTNGKTTTCHLLHACLEAHRSPAGKIGTIENRIGDFCTPASLTTPEAIELQQLLYMMEQNNVSQAVVEVSSHALDMHRVAAVEFDVGIFLNMTPEHLEYHKTMEAYFEAKSKLFKKGVCKHGIVCVDDVWGQKLASTAEIPVTTFGFDRSSDVRVEAIDKGLDGTDVIISGLMGDVTVKSKLVGTVNALNITATYIAATILGIDKSLLIDTLEICTAPPGRFEIVSGKAPYLAVVDYAHTPDALAALIRTTRNILPPSGKITVVLGARGHRFAAKRSLMGETAETTESVIYTTDSPGDEDPMTIVKDMIGQRHGHLSTIDNHTQCCNICIELDRRQAIERAVAAANPGDAILITGRGHETSQKIGSLRVSLDDRSVAKAAVARRLEEDLPRAAQVSI